MKPIHPSRFVAALVGLAFAAVSAHATLIAHYTFDVDNAGTTPDSVGSAFATLGGAVSINTSVAGQLGGGVLEMTNANGSNLVSVDGAVTSNSFSWTNDARTVTFWWKAKTPNANTLTGTCVSFGDTSANGNRFDIREVDAGPAAGHGQLRVEVQGAGQTTNPSNFDDGNWHFVAVTVPNDATFADVSWFSGVRGGTLSGDLNTSASTQDITTGFGPLVFGDSIITGSPPTTGRPTATSTTSSSTTGCSRQKRFCSSMRIPATSSPGRNRRGLPASPPLAAASGN